MSILKKSSIMGSLLIASIFMMNSCNKKTSAKEQTAGIQLANLDTTAKLGDDFYQYACGGWMKNNPLTGEYSRFGSFDKLAENNREQLKGLIEEIASKPAKSGSVEQKIADMFNLAMDSTKLNTDGVSPLKADLDKIAAIKDKEGIEKAIPELMQQGIHPYFGIYVDADPKSSKENLLQTYQGGLGMGQRDYYLENDANTKNIRDKYQIHVAKMFELTGFDAATAQKNAADVMRIETRLAKSAYDNVKLRDPQANYNKMAVADAQKLVPEINWDNLLAGLNLKDVKNLSISQKENMVEVGKIINSEPIPVQVAYLQWNVINDAASYLSDSIYKEHFDFYGKVMSGKQQPQPRWKRAVANVEGSLGEAVGQMYVKKYFPPAAKERMEKLVKNLQKSLGERIKGLTWMGDSTKQKALEKLEAFYVKVGYPNKWRDYSKLDIKKDNYWENIKRASKFESDYMFAKLGKPVDKDEWLMTPQTVNAYYNPSTNEICFPAGILQYPFFDMNADDAFNYGAIGVVIGHEMTHGFDDQGRQFDKDGNLKDWWTAEDAKKFTENANKLADFYSNIEVAPETKANGKFTLGENIADQGGLQVSYFALQNVLKTNPLPVKDGFTPEQRFFLAYANVWAGNIRPEEILKRTKTDPHSLGKWRVDAALPHIEGWYKAFDIKPTDKMYVALEKRAIVW
ncbi:Endothelin-converting enzyme [uncultured Paludibacter sp.]|uniref:Endothelin-converting enzyme n=1 Tax=uncultured Paludibacter sp. TaxID=497635 RepID=A0A653AFX6_9BACT|nr:Endothelin-converting enzyme [uncultured Paludibacter sp.]